MVDSSKWSVIEAGRACRQVDRELLAQGGEADFLPARQARNGAGVVVMAFDEAGQAETVERGRDLHAPSVATGRSDPPEDIIDPTSWRSRPDRGARASRSTTEATDIKARCPV
jgi:5-methyltetrahydrofolate--homocysteine methyltransferase